jgi:hypothetical protein
MPRGLGVRDDDRMKQHYHALVWIDHKVARIFHFDDDTNQTEIVHSTHPHEHLHHKANSGDSGHARVDKLFLERVSGALGNSGAILIAGPAGAKTELHTFMKQKHPQLAARVSAVETLDHPTDGELLAHGRRFFRADDRMRLQL